MPLPSVSRFRLPSEVPCSIKKEPGGRSQFSQSKSLPCFVPPRVIHATHETTWIWMDASSVFLLGGPVSLSFLSRISRAVATCRSLAPSLADAAFATARGGAAMVEWSCGGCHLPLPATEGKYTVLCLSVAAVVVATLSSALSLSLPLS